MIISLNHRRTRIHPISTDQGGRGNQTVRGLKHSDLLVWSSEPDTC